jgi:hypothetical protein
LGRRGELAVSDDLRRDCGIWCALVAITQTVLGLQVHLHLRGRMWEYFVQPVKGTLLPRIDPFGAANYTGLVAVAASFLVALHVTSDDVSVPAARRGAQGRGGRTLGTLARHNEP